MLRSFSLLACFVLSVSLVISCGGDSGGDGSDGGKKKRKDDAGEEKNSSGNEKQNVSEDEGAEGVASSTNDFRSKLLGTWRSECSGKSDAEAPFFVIHQSFKEDGLTAKFRYFADAECDDPTYSIITHGSYEIEAQRQEASDARLITSAFDRGQVAIFKNAQALNDREICGYSDWEIGKAKEVNDELPNCVFADAVAGFTDEEWFGGAYQLAGDKRLHFYDGNDLDDKTVYSRVE